MLDVFRKTYKSLSEATKDEIYFLKTQAEILLTLIEEAVDHNSGDPRMLALAKTNLEQSVMWAIKAIT